MAKPHSRSEFKQYCLRNLGFPVIKINVDDDQLEDRIDEALNYWFQYHNEGNEKIYYKHLITQLDKDNGYITLPDNVMGAVSVFPLSSYLGTSSDMFSIEYQIALNNLFTFDSTSMVPYYMTRMHIDLISEMIVGEPQIRFNRHRNRLHIDWTWAETRAANISANSAGTVAANTYSKTLNGSGTSFLTDFANGDFITLYSAANEYVVKQIDRVTTNSILTLKEKAPFSNSAANFAVADIGQYLLVEAYQVLDPDEFTDMWADRFLEKYTTALFKRQWGNNLKKYSGIQMTGGVTFNGQQIYEEAEAEIEKLENDMIWSYSLPPGMEIG